MSTADIMQIVMAGFGSIGFALIFGLRGDKLLTIGVSGALSWSCFVIGSLQGSPRMGLFWGVIMAALISESEARRRKTPVIVMEVPILIPLIPGGDLYRMMDAIMRNGIRAAMDSIMWLLQEVFIIAAGIILVSTIVQGYIRVMQKYVWKNGSIFYADEEENKTNQV